MVEPTRPWPERLFRGRTAVAGAVLLTACLGVGTAAATATKASTTTFDFDKGNAALELIYPRTGPVLRDELNKVAMDGTLILRLSAEMEGAWFDATAPYHTAAIGIYTDLGRRPASESSTNRNINIAMLYSSYHVLNSLFSKENGVWRDMLTSVGLNPDDNSTDKSSPVGLGNLAGEAMVANRENDGMNQLGNMSGKYNQAPYQDYTGYKPVNTAYQMNDPSRWQPQMVTKGNGLFESQVFVTPQIAKTKPFTFANPAQFDSLVPAPVASNVHNIAAYRQQADAIMDLQAHLTDEQKMSAEFFNDKLLFASGFRGDVGPNLLNFIDAAAAGHLAAFDALLAAWYYKVKYDTERPVTAIHYLYGKQNVTGWGGPGKGTVSDLPGNEWTSYLSVDDAAEYVSGTSAFCGAQGTVGKLFAGSDKTDVVFSVPKGGSYIEPGVTPRQDTTLHWTSWTKLVDDCALSRQLGGVHFKAATDAGKALGNAIGQLSYQFMQRHLTGQR